MGIDLDTARTIPVKIFLRATDTLVEFRTLGLKWVDAGRPRDGQLYTDFCTAERAYNDFMDKYLFCFSTEQREEWSRINSNLDS